MERAQARSTEDKGKQPHLRRAVGFDAGLGLAAHLAPKPFVLGLLETSKHKSKGDVSAAQSIDF